MKTRQYYILFIIIISFSISCFSQNQKQIDSLETAIASLPNDTIKLQAINELSSMLVDIAPERAIKYSKEAIKIAEEKGYKYYQALASNNVGNGYYNLADFKMCLTYYLKALKIQEDLGKKSGILSSLGSIGNVYIALGKPNEGLLYFERALKIAEELGKKNAIASCLISIGTIYSDKKDFNKALEYFFKSLKLFQEVGNEDAIGTNFNNIADAYLNLKENDKALSYITKAKDLFEKIGNVYSLSLAYNNIGDYYHTIGNEQKAIEYFKKGLEKGQEIEANEYIISSYKGMYTSYKNLGDYKNALGFHELFKQFNDSVFSNESLKQISQMQEKIDNEKKEQEIILLKKDKKITEDAQYEQSLINKTVFAVGALLLLLTLVSVRGFMQKKKANTILGLKNQKIEFAYKIIEEHQKEVFDSINYAKRIQYALLAHENLFVENLSSHFVFFKPKDIVSGDFYWATVYGDDFYLAVCDSTGHGVPGAFMSLLSIGFLSEAIKEKNIQEPNKVFDYVRKRLIESISSEEQKDGFDGILLRINKVTGKVTYAAANNRPVLMSNNIIQNLSCDKMPVGKGERLTPFSEFEINHITGDTIYLYTDGYADQFGGAKGKKFKYKPLNELLATNSGLDLKLQSVILDQQFSDWKGNLEQVDDVLVIGIKI
jgi:serine phosphatase RsbU (regulator of sigma subunit)